MKKNTLLPIPQNKKKQCITENEEFILNVHTLKKPVKSSYQPLWEQRKVDRSCHAAGFH